MSRIADVGAAVIGTGFIGTVHVEALRRIGVQVRGVLGSTPERGAARASALGVRRAYASLDELLDDPTVDVVHVTSPNDLHLPQASAILAAGRHVVCEKPLAMTAAESRRARRAGRARAASSTRSTSTSASTRSTSTPASVVADGGLGDVRLVTGRYFQDWLLLETDWNWRLEPDQRRRAAGGRRHRLALARPDDVRDRPAGRSRSWPTSRRSSRPASEPTGPGRDVLDRARGRDRRPRRCATEDAATILLRFENGARGAVSVSPDQRRPEELAPVRDRRLDARRRPGTPRQPDQLWLGHRERPERDPHPEPGA